MKIAVGFFDGLHLGHQEILRTADAVLTFRNHPLSVLAPDRQPVLLMSEEERLAAIRSLGIRKIHVLDFTAALAMMEPERFLQDVLMRAENRITTIRCGANWRFGCGGRGDAALLRQSGLSVEAVPCLSYAGERISSSRIRACLAEGAVESACEMLGRPYTVRGRIVSGKGLGRQLGFPTVNLAIERPLVLRAGVYAVEALGHRAVANYGVAPTLGDSAWREPMLEVHFLDAVDVEGRADLGVSIRSFLRPERKFANLEELKKQIMSDCERITL